VAELAAPSLQLLNADYTNATHVSQIPHLCRLICDTDHQFRLVRLDFSDSRFQFTAETHSKSVHAQPFRISIPESISLEELCAADSGSSDGNGVPRQYKPAVWEHMSMRKHSCPPKGAYGCQYCNVHVARNPTWVLVATRWLLVIGCLGNSITSGVTR
jgi:hypothetical protein